MGCQAKKNQSVSDVTGSVAAIAGSFGRSFIYGFGLSEF
jgi:hypothetical protein